ncbi:MAG: CDP-alcohol phosphatidyltransferase family protein [Brevibacterium aurantiacum]|uniref:CDP-alcohol phosphatidyltransferase n=1 Tax=Brevibacterium aurantiacum TaxID=273384 RepID=A0A1D7W2G6_BREAU|nr:CDP-alcohol phosphatidyltransferase family protein [Brevibacterium aurantiacum]MDN5592745.1 CDP-alcohol phosphatidyltransferase family protein [Brevibacterium sp.]AOP53152.1 CDP-alcohol phosphatidyltransferase [Brevibacterium aurantiacum]AZL05391.1 CDP-alcohol phosphatidyltransferase [Brevibacterium aurantiacum]AZL08976.1 CDP-alcohol phosphatidyltransferase [Brevibacterium aurantiacum]AZL12587.1 CDP-alcohol phosphatidyltransferase [Brevibacterium aurantiacum]
MSTSRRPPPTPGLRLFAPLSVLGAAIVLALAVHPQWSTILIMAALAVLGAGRSLFRAEKWQPADDITTLRLGLIMVFAALVLGNVGFSWPAVTVGALALILDACDGYVARRTRTTSAGADFDESVDALVVLVLSVALIPVWGWWVLLPGTFYYLFRGATLIRPDWRRQLPPSVLRKTIAASQGILLLTAGSPLAVENPWIGIMSAAIALAALVISFGRDVLWLEQHAEARRPTPSR